MRARVLGIILLAAALGVATGTASGQTIGCRAGKSPGISGFPVDSEPPRSICRDGTL
jgi:hypothetical protein